MTHFATADERGDAFFAEQLARFARVGACRCATAHPERRCCTPPTARRRCATPAAHFDLVRCGIAIYGLDPFGATRPTHDLEPALELRSYVAEVKPCAAGESTGYGRRFVAAARRRGSRPCRSATATAGGAG